MTPIFSILIFFVVIVFTAVVFFGWIAFSVIRFVFGGVGSLLGPTRSRGRINASRVTNTVQCSLRMCGAINPAEAKFCRHCGRGLPAAQRVQVRRAAVW